MALFKDKEVQRPHYNSHQTIVLSFMIKTNHYSCHQQNMVLFVRQMFNEFIVS